MERKLWWQFPSKSQTLQSYNTLPFSFSKDFYYNPDFSSWFSILIQFLCYDFFFTYTSSKLEVLNNNDYCSKSVASSLRFSIQFFKTQLKIPRNRCATFFKRLGDTYKHTPHCGRFCCNLPKKYEVRYVSMTAKWPENW